MNKTAPITASLIVSTYNWPDALKLCLNSIRAQAVLPAEVIIADDGSGEDTASLIRVQAKNFPVPLIHVWQTDDGFQLAKIRNKAIATATSSYLIQVDGDQILEKHFIKDHLAFSKKGTFVSGTRVQLSQELSSGLLSRQDFQVSVFAKGITNFSNGIRFSPLSYFLAQRYKAKDIPYVRGCNMAFWKSDLAIVNGYNEALIGWGREDSDLAIRLINSGIKKRIFKFGAVLYHLFHHETPRENISVNDSILHHTIEYGIKSCKTGLSQYL